MVWSTAVSALSGLGSIAGAFGGGGSDFNRNDTFWASNWGAKGTIRGTFEEANRQKVHPLWLAGSGTSGSGPVIAGQSNTGSRIGDALRGAGDALRGYSARKAAANAERRADAKTAAEIEALKMQSYRDRAAGGLDDMRTGQINQQLNASKLARAAQASNAQQDQLKLPNGSKWNTGASAKQQTVEDHYGSLIGEPYGVWRAYKDAQKHYRRDFIEPRRKKMREANRHLRRKPYSGGGY